MEQPDKKRPAHWLEYSLALGDIGMDLRDEIEKVFAKNNVRYRISSDAQRIWRDMWIDAFLVNTTRNVEGNNLADLMIRHRSYRYGKLIGLSQQDSYNFYSDFYSSLEWSRLEMQRSNNTMIRLIGISLPLHGDLLHSFLYTTNYKTVSKVLEKMGSVGMEDFQEVCLHASSRVKAVLTVFDIDTTETDSAFAGIE